MTLRYPYVAVSVWYFGWPHKYGVWMCLVSKPMSVQDANGAMNCQLMFDDGFWQVKKGHRTKEHLFRPFASLLEKSTKHEA